MCLKPGAASGSATRRSRKCLVNTARIAFLNRIHNAIARDPQEIRPAAEKFNEFLGVKSVCDQQLSLLRIDVLGLPQRSGAQSLHRELPFGFLGHSFS